MAMIGTIKEIATDGGQAVAIVETGAGPAVSAVCMFPAGMECQPVVGDMVIYDRTGKDCVIFAVLKDAVEGQPGEVWFSARTASGVVKSQIVAKQDGSIKASNDEGFFEMTAAGQMNINGNFTVDA